MTNKQLAALSDARFEINRRGLERFGRYFSADRSAADSHHYNTIMSLVQRGYLHLYSSGQIAHITDSGIEALELEVQP